ncbi:MAG: family 43 glycosylhydrolase [Fibrobacter sp.]|nr:family 43 glycosylhydrolase [Fibrobacter sp.]
MKIRTGIFCMAMMAVQFLVTENNAENPLIQTNYTPDPAPMVYNDTVFLYTGHDEDNATGFLMYNYLLYTSTDLVNWTDHGEIASTKSFKWANANGAWAAQCIPRNGKFYYYASQQLKGIGVLVSDSPYGPFTDPLGKPLVNNGLPCIDPTVFIDDDGQAYLYWGNPDAYYVKLNKDMISYSGDIVKIPKLQTYQEGPWLYKRDKHYYLAWSSTCCPEGIGYAMSNSPTGPWTFKGSIMDGNPNSSGNQPGIFDFKGLTYTTGFTNELWYSIQGGRSIRYERRSASLAKITFNADGTIPKLPWFGVGNPTPGVPQVGSLNPYDTVQAETICFSKGVRTEVCKDVSGKMNVDSIHNGDYIKVKGVDFKTAGPDLFEARVASGSNGGSIELRIDSLNGQKIGTCTVQGTGGWQNWVTKSCDVINVTGKHDLFFKFTGGNGLLFNFNWWKFSSSTGIRSKTGNKAGYANEIKITVDNKIVRKMHLDFSPSYLHGVVSVSLYDVTGRQAGILYKNRLFSQQLSLPIEQNSLKTGTYLVRVSVNEKMVLTKKIKF